MNTNTSSSDHNDDEYDDLLIFDMEDRHSSSKLKENRGDENDYADVEDIIFDDT